MISPRMEPEGGEFSAVEDGGRGGVSMERRGCKELGKCNQYFKVIFCLFKIDIYIQVVVESQAVVRNTTKDAGPPPAPLPCRGNWAQSTGKPLIQHCDPAVDIDTTHRILSDFSSFPWARYVRA